LTGFLAAVFQPLSCQPLIHLVIDPVEQVLAVGAQGHLGRPPEYGRFVGQALIAALLPPGQPG
jgi:hypothetical protein